MHTQPGPRGKRSQRSAVLLWIILLGACLGSRPTGAQTYISAEPIPSEQIVGTANLAKILDLGYPKLQIWSERLLRNCQIVQEVIHVLAEKGVITTIDPSNTHYAVAAGGSALYASTSKGEDIAQTPYSHLSRFSLARRSYCRRPRS